MDSSFLASAAHIDTLLNEVTSESFNLSIEGTHKYNKPPKQNSSYVNNHVVVNNTHSDSETSGDEEPVVNLITGETKCNSPDVAVVVSRFVNNIIEDASNALQFPERLSDYIQDAQQETSNVDPTIEKPSTIAYRPSGAHSNGNSANVSPTQTIEPIGFPIPVVENAKSKKKSASSHSENSSCVLPIVPKISKPGDVAPIWVNDEDRVRCARCDGKFTFTRRRHHCRACGEIFCAQCCSRRVSLGHLCNKEGRVCESCANILEMAEAEKSSIPTDYGSELPPSQAPVKGKPNPANPLEYCSNIPPHIQEQANTEDSPAIVYVPRQSVVTEEDQFLDSTSNQNLSDSTERHVHFADGVVPGGDLAEDHPISRIDHVRSLRRKHKTYTMKSRESIWNDTTSLIPSDHSLLPPCLLDANDPKSRQDNPNTNQVFSLCNDDSAPPVALLINNHLSVLVKCVSLSCCGQGRCWYYVTRGMGKAGQREIVFIFSVTPTTNYISHDVLNFIYVLYQQALLGSFIGPMDYMPTEAGASTFLARREHAGFIFIEVSRQCMNNLPPVEAPFLAGILLHRLEMPWAKCFAVRLLLRLGLEFKHYPCPIVSKPERNPVFEEISQTILGVLIDFDKFSYNNLVSINGAHLEILPATQLYLPRVSYNQVMKALSSGNDNHICFGLSLHTSADSHLVCTQEDDGSYRSHRIIWQESSADSSLAAAFVIFNGSLANDSNIKCQCNIIEDGIVIQVSPNSLSQLKDALYSMQPYSLSYDNVNVSVTWTDEMPFLNKGLKSPLDGMNLEFVQFKKIAAFPDYVTAHYLMRWTDLFFIHLEEELHSPVVEPEDPHKRAERFAGACCLALSTFLMDLFMNGFSKIALRITVSNEHVGFEIGGNNTKLPQMYMDCLDNALIPLLTQAAAQLSITGSEELELHFYILEC